MKDKYEEIFNQFWGDYKDIKTKSATGKMIDMNMVKKKVIELFFVIRKTIQN